MQDRLGKEIRVDDIILWGYSCNTYFGIVTKLMRTRLELDEIYRSVDATLNSPALLMKTARSHSYTRRGDDVLILSPGVAILNYNI